MAAKFESEDNREPFEVETLRIAKNKVRLQVNKFSGQQEDIHVCYAPAIEVSGYGNTPEEAKESYNHNILTFLEDLSVMRPAEQQKELRNLGWSVKKFHRKQFSKTFIDGEGVLQNFTNGKVEGVNTYA